MVDFVLEAEQAGEAEPDRGDRAREHVTVDRAQQLFEIGGGELREAAVGEAHGSTWGGGSSVVPACILADPGGATIGARFAGPLVGRWGAYGVGVDVPCLTPGFRGRRLPIAGSAPVLKAGVVERAGGRRDGADRGGFGMTTPVNNRFADLFIGIAGMIGAGKSTLAQALGEHLDLDVHYEPVIDNVYLADFYRDTARYSFAMQIYLLNRRFQQHQEIIWRGRPAVQDRTIYEDAVFAKMLAEQGLMDERDYQTYLSLFRHMSNFMARPHLIVYLDVPPEASMERIHQRARGVEQGISLDYLRALYAGYEAFIGDISRLIPVIRVDYNRYATAEEMATIIEREYLDHSFMRTARRPTTGDEG